MDEQNNILAAQSRKRHCTARWEYNKKQALERK